MWGGCTLTVKFQSSVYLSVYGVHLTFFVSCQPALLQVQSHLPTILEIYESSAFQLMYNYFIKRLSKSLRYTENNIRDNISPWRTPAEILNVSINFPGVLYML